MMSNIFTAKPNRDAVFHVTFPEEWTAADLKNMFSTFGEEKIILLTLVVSSNNAN